jgi:hypothetical protein
MGSTHQCIFLGQLTFTKNGNEAQQKFLEDFTIYICKGYKPFSTCENMWPYVG